MAQGKRRGFEGGVVPQAAEEPRGPAGSHRKGFRGVRNQAKVRKRWFVNYLGNGVEQLGSGFRGVGLRGHPSGLSEEALDLCAPPDGFAGVATPMSPPLKVRRV